MHFSLLIQIHGHVMIHFMMHNVNYYIQSSLFQHHQEHLYRFNVVSQLHLYVLVYSTDSPNHSPQDLIASTVCVLQSLTWVPIYIATDDYPMFQLLVHCEDSASHTPDLVDILNFIVNHGSLDLPFVLKN